MMVLILVATSSDGAIDALGAWAWKFFQHSPYPVFYLLALHRTYFVFMWFTLHFRRPVSDWFAFLAAQPDSGRVSGRGLRVGRDAGAPP